MIKRKIKSAGYVNDKYEIILDDDSQIDGVIGFILEKEEQRFGELTIRVILPAFNKTESSDQKL